MQIASVQEEMDGMWENRSDRSINRVPIVEALEGTNTATSNSHKKKNFNTNKHS